MKNKINVNTQKQQNTQNQQRQQSINVTGMEDKAKTIYSFLTMDWGAKREINLATGNMVENPVPGAVFSFLPEMITFKTGSHSSYSGSHTDSHTDRIPSFESFLETYKKGIAAAVGCAEDAHGERVSFGILPDSDEAVFNLIGKGINEDEFYDRFEESRERLEGELKN